MIPSIEPSEVGTTGLLWLLISYGYILYYASNLISEGSDLLLLVPALAGLVGGVVLPLLGAVPDGAIMLFSGLGDVEEAQETLSVGVGALAGSTIMLLTVPWAMSVYYGRVNFTEKTEDGQTKLEPNYMGKPKLDEKIGTCGGLSTTGVAFSEEIQHGAKMMMVTTLPYFLIQGPAFFLDGDRETVSAGEKNWAMAGFVVCMVFFVFYLYLQLKMSNEGADKLRRIAVTKEALKAGSISLSGALLNQVDYIEKVADKEGVTEESALLKYKSKKDVDGTMLPSSQVVKYLKDTLGEAFRAYDRDHNGTLDKKEFTRFLMDFHENIGKEKVERVFSRFDDNNDGTIDYNEFIAACYIIIKEANQSEMARQASRKSNITKLSLSDDDGEDGGEDDEEAEEIPEDFTSLPPDQQQKAILRRAFSMLTLGTVLVLMFSDPMVDVLQEVANRANIPAFYVSFILAPLASNASEVIASQYYAAKKTRKTITVSLTALEGAASMNNTFCLSIFMALIYFRGLAWKYSAETISIILVQFGMGFVALRDKMTAMEGFVVLSVFPLSIVFVATLEYFGLD